MMRALTLSWAIALSACAIGADGSNDDSTQPIIGGKLAVAYPEAGYINIDFTAKGGLGCSAALIAPQVVLTAGHCIDGHHSWQVHLGTASQTSTIAATYDWNEHGAAKVNPHHHDVGLVFLAAPIPLSTYPTIARGALPNGSRVTNVGRVLDGAITSRLYAADSLVSDGGSIGFAFDYQAIDVIQPGDSGGPDFQAGTHSIVAVNSGSSGGLEVLARVDLLADWIDAEVRAHGGYAPIPTSPFVGKIPRPPVPR